MSSSEFLEELRERVIKSFMDILVMKEIETDALSGYDVIGLIHRRFGVLVSSGTVYSLLYSMERDGLIEGEQNRRKRVYTLTEKGEQNMKLITKANAEMRNLLRSILKLNADKRLPQ